jgi:HK97 family phage prohead protease
MNAERRAAKIAAKPQGELELRAFAYNVLDDYRTVFLPGCATRSLDKRLPVFAWSHDVADVIGRATAWRDTPTGPVVVGRLDVDARVPRALQALAQVESGTITECSIGFSATRAGKRAPTKAEEERWPGVEVVYTDIDVYEVSLVFAGAVPGSEVLALRRRGPLSRWSPERLDAEVDAALSVARRMAVSSGDLVGLDRLRGVGSLDSAIDDAIDLALRRR